MIVLQMVNTILNGFFDTFISGEPLRNIISVLHHMWCAVSQKLLGYMWHYMFLFFCTSHKSTSNWSISDFKFDFEILIQNKQSRYITNVYISSSNKISQSFFFFLAQQRSLDYFCCWSHQHLSNAYKSLCDYMSLVTGKENSPTCRPFQEVKITSLTNCY